MKVVFNSNREKQKVCKLIAERFCPRDFDLDGMSPKKHCDSYSNKCYECWGKAITKNGIELEVK